MPLAVAVAIGVLAGLASCAIGAAYLLFQDALLERGRRLGSQYAHQIEAARPRGNTPPPLIRFQLGQLRQYEDPDKGRVAIRARALLYLLTGGVMLSGSLLMALWPALVR